MKIKKPKISYITNGKLEGCSDFSCLEFNENSKYEIILKDITIDSCIFNGINFNNIKFNNVSFIDCIFNDCDISNLCICNNLILRTEFNRCKLLGLLFKNIKLEDVLMINTNLELSSFDGCLFKNVIIDSSNLNGSRFIKNKLLIEISKSDLIGTEFINTSLNGIDLSTCHIGDILIGINDLKGVKLNEYQALDLIKILGIEVI